VHSFKPPSPHAHGIEGWVGPRACMDYTEKSKFLTLAGLELRPFRCRVRSQSLNTGHKNIYFFKIYFNIILPSKRRSSKQYFHFRIPFIILYIQANCSGHIMLLDFIISVVTSGAGALHYAVSSSFVLDPNILPSAL
jgi:hypothetical protein